MSESADPKAIEWLALAKGNEGLQTLMVSRRADGSVGLWVQDGPGLPPWLLWQVPAGSQVAELAGFLRDAYQRKPVDEAENLRRHRERVGDLMEPSDG